MSYEQTSPSVRTGRLTSTLFFFILFAAMLYWAGRLFWPFLGTIGFAGVLAIVFRPWYDAFGRWWPRMKPTWRALLLDLIIAFLFILPVSLLIWSAVTEMQDLYPLIASKFSNANEWIRQTPTEMFPWLQKLPASIVNQLDIRSVQVQMHLKEAGEKVIAILATAGTVAAKRFVNITLDLAILIFCLFFMLRDGDKMFGEFQSLIPLSHRAKTRLTRTMQRTVIGVVRGTFLLSTAQTLMMAMGLFVVQSQAILLLSFITFASTFIPAIGTSLVTIPLAIYFLVAGPLWKGLFLLLWGTLGMGLIDNILRPFLSGAGQEMSFFWLFFAIMGGLEVFGLKGLLLGPLILAMMPVFFEIYRERYLDIPKD